MQQSEIQEAYEALKRAARELEASASITQEELRNRLRSVSERVLELLDQTEDSEEPEDVVARLERQSQDIARDLRRVQRMMDKDLFQEDRRSEV